MQARLEHDPVAQRATEWFFELRSNDVAVERIGEWQQWLAADAAHARAFEDVETFWRTARQVVTTHWPTDADVEKDRYDGDTSISQWRETFERRRPRANRSLRHLALAAGISAIALAGGWLGLKPQRSSAPIQTAVGETRTIDLPDGSAITASGATLLSTHFGKSAREVQLDRGEAFFRVARDATRPFIVRAGEASITAVGTAFNVRRAGERVVVAVAEGAVRVSSVKKPPAKLEVGQQLSLEPAESRQEISSVDSGSVAGWREGQLQYMNEPLETVVADLARYSTRQIRVTDPQVANLRVTGIVFEKNIDSWLASLEATFPVRVVRDERDGVALESSHQ